MIKSLLIISLMLGLATCTLYSLKPDFTVTNSKSGDQLAHAYYDMKKNSEGWNYLKVYASPTVSLDDQHRGVGFLEGYLTYNDISYSYKNLQASVLKGNEPKPKLVDFMNNQIDYIDKMTESHPKQLYWQYAKAKMEQLRFTYRGFLTRLHVENRLDLYITFIQFYCLSNNGDLQDLIPAYQEEYQSKGGINKEQQQSGNPHNENLKKQQQPGNCNLIAKLIDGQIYIGHSTHNIYEFLLRVFKTYNFPSKNGNVGSETLAFSSRPGDLISKDDFYVLDSGLIVMQTSLANMNPHNLNDLSSDTLPTWLRQTIACHLARNIAQWTNYFLKQRSGTHNNQWVITDSRNLKTKKNVAVYIQQGFSEYDVIDITDLLFEQGYIVSYNIPYSKKIYDKLGYQKYPYTFDSEPRAAAYKKYSPKLTNEEDMKKWLITNEQEDITTGLAPRYDLTEKGKRAFGLTDCKIISPNTLKQNYIWAISGPSTSNGRFPAFEWKDWPNISHEGMPAKFDFPWVKVNIHQPKELPNIILEKSKDRQEKIVISQM